MSDGRNFMPTLCLDFDGVLHSYTSGWQGMCTIADPPVPGALDFLARAVQHFEVSVYSTRSSNPVARACMETWLYEQLCEKFGDQQGLEIAASIDFPKRKPAAFVTLDDRAMCFTGVWPPVDELLAFKPWNKP